MSARYPGCKDFHPRDNRRISDNSIMNKLAFNGYHIHGSYQSLNGYEWVEFIDSYPTVESFHNSFSYLDTGQFLSPREIYLSKEDPSNGENVKWIKDNNGVTLWDEEMENAFLTSL